MADVRSALRALRIFEVFDESAGALSLSAIAAALDIPVSSCFQLVRTLVAGGYLYGIGKRQVYYPTRRLLDIMQRVAVRDPLIPRIQGLIDEVRDRTGETAACSILQGDKTLYLAAAESRQLLRVTIAAGMVRPLHSTASGKALLGALLPEVRARMLRQMEFTAFTARTISSAADLERELEAAAHRGYYVTFGEGADGLSGIGVPLLLDGTVYAVAVSGPRERIEANEADLAEALREIVARRQLALPDGQ